MQMHMRMRIYAYSQAVRFPGGYPAEERLYVLRALAMQARIYKCIYTYSAQNCMHI